MFGFFVTISVVGVAISRGGMVRSWSRSVVRCRGGFWVVDRCRCWVVWCRCWMGGMVTSVGSQFSMVIFMAVSMSRDFDERTNVSKSHTSKNSQNDKCLKDKDKEDIKRPIGKLGPHNNPYLKMLCNAEVKRKTH